MAEQTPIVGSHTAIFPMVFWGLFGLSHNLIARLDARLPRVLPIIPATPSARLQALVVAFVLVLIRFFRLGFSPTF